MAEVKKKKSAAREIKSIAPKEGKQCVYSNHFGVSQSPFDVRLTFGEITDVTDGTVEVTQRVQVTLSLPFAKIVSDMLANQMKGVEIALEQSQAGDIVGEGKK